MVVEECITGIGKGEKMKGFQMHLFAFGAPIPVFFFIMCSKVMYILLFLFVGIFVFAHTYLCPLSCAIGIFTCICS